MVLFHTGVDRVSRAASSAWTCSSSCPATSSPSCCSRRSATAHGSIRFGRFYSPPVPAPAAGLDRRRFVAIAAVWNLIATPVEVDEAGRLDARRARCTSSNWFFISESTDYFADDVDRNPRPALLVAVGRGAVLPALAAPADRHLLGHRPAAAWAGCWATGPSSPPARWRRSPGRSGPPGLTTQPRLLRHRHPRLPAARSGRSSPCSPASSAGPAATGSATTGSAPSPRQLAVLVVGRPRSSTSTRSLRGVLATATTVVAHRRLGGCPDQPGRPGPVARHRSSYLGQISYGIYLWHWPVVLAIERLIDDVSTEALTLLDDRWLATGLASLSFQLMEAAHPAVDPVAQPTWRIPVIAAGLAGRACASPPFVVVPAMTDAGHADRRRPSASPPRASPPSPPRTSTAVMPSRSYGDDGQLRRSAPRRTAPSSRATGPHIAAHRRQQRRRCSSPPSPRMAERARPHPVARRHVGMPRPERPALGQDGPVSPDDTYTHGHADSVLRVPPLAHGLNSAAVPAPRTCGPGLDLLDVGCGPGTITADLAAGWRRAGWSASDRSPEVIAAAAADHAVVPGSRSASATSTPSTCRRRLLRRGPRPPGPPAPVRPGGAPCGRCGGSCRPDGVVAVRDSDYARLHVGPARPAARPLAGGLPGRRPGQRRRPRRRAPAQGLGPRGRVRLGRRVGATCGRSPTPDERAWWAGLWADRVTAHDAGRPGRRRRATPPATSWTEMAAAFHRWAADRHRRLHRPQRRDPRPALIVDRHVGSDPIRWSHHGGACQRSDPSVVGGLEVPGAVLEGEEVGGAVVEHHLDPGPAPGPVRVPPPLVGPATARPSPPPACRPEPGRRRR